MANVRPLVWHRRFLRTPTDVPSVPLEVVLPIMQSCPIPSRPNARRLDCLVVVVCPPLCERRGHRNCAVDDAQKHRHWPRVLILIMPGRGDAKCQMPVVIA